MLKPPLVHRVPLSAECYPNSVFWTPDGRFLIVGNIALRYDEAGFTKVWEFPGFVYALHPGGEYILVYNDNDKRLNLYRVSCEGGEFRADSVAELKLANPPCSIDWSYDGKYIVIGDFEGNIQLYELTSNGLKQHALIDVGPSPIFTIRFNPCMWGDLGYLIAFGGDRLGFIEVYRRDHPNTSCMLDGVEGDVYGISFSSDGMYMSVVLGGDHKPGKICVADVMNKKLLACNDADTRLKSVIWIGTDLIIAGGEQHEIHIYRWDRDKEAIELLCRLKVGSEWVVHDRGLAYNPHKGFIAVTDLKNLCVHIYSIKDFVRTTPSRHHLLLPYEWALNKLLENVREVLEHLKEHGLAKIDTIADTIRRLLNNNDYKTAVQAVQRICGGNIVSKYEEMRKIFNLIRLASCNEYKGLISTEVAVQLLDNSFRELKSQLDECRQL